LRKPAQRLFKIQWPLFKTQWPLKTFRYESA